MPARSLLAMSTRVAVQNVRSLTDIGNIPYSLARPFLLKVESPKQLREIEKNSPHIMNDDKELWLEFIKRDIPQWDQYDIPHESDSWYDIYCDLLEQVQREVEEGALQLKQAVDKFYSEKASHAAVLVKDTSRLPKPRRRFHHSAGGRSEPKKAGIFSSKRNKVLAVPTHQLHSGASRINHVPQWLVDEHKHAPSSSAASSASKHTSKPVNTTSGAPSSSSSSSTRVSAPRGRPPPRPTTPTKKENSSELPPGSRPIVPRKRSLENNGPVPRMSTAATTTSVRTSSPVRLSPTTPGKAIIRKRPIASQPNIFIQQKKRKV